MRNKEDRLGSRVVPFELFRGIIVKWLIVPTVHPSIWSGLTVLVLLVNASLVSGQTNEPKPVTVAQPEGALAVGTRVILKEAGTPLDDNGRPVPTQNEFAFVVDRIEGDRLLVVTLNKRKKGYLRRDQVFTMNEAIANFDAEIANAPGKAKAHWMRGRLRAAQNKSDLALADYNEAIRLDPNDARYYASRSGLLLATNQPPDRVLADCDKAIQLGSHEAKVYFHRAWVWMSKSDFKRAITDLDEGIRLDPTDPWAWCRRFECWMQVGNPDNALSDINEAIRLDPNDATQYGFRGTFWIFRRDLDKGIADYTEAIRCDPKDSRNYSARGRAWSKKGDLDRAIADYNEAIKVNPNEAIDYVDRGRVWERKIDHDKAIADYTAAIRLKPDFADAYFRRGQAWGEKRNREKEIADYSSAIQLEPRSALYRGSRQRMGKSWIACPGDRRLRRSRATRTKRTFELPQPRDRIAKRRPRWWFATGQGHHGLQPSHRA